MNAFSPNSKSHPFQILFLSFCKIGVKVSFFIFRNFSFLQFIDFLVKIVTQSFFVLLIYKVLKLCVFFLFTKSQKKLLLTEQRKTKNHYYEGLWKALSCFNFEVLNKYSNCFLRVNSQNGTKI